MSDKTMTLGDFRKEICEKWAHLPDDTGVLFGTGDLSFSRIRNRQYRGDSSMPAMVQIEFREAYQITLDP